MTVAESLSEGLKRLEVVVKGGGNLVSHPPVFSPDSKTLYLIQNNTVLIHDVGSGRCVSKFCTPCASTIANIGIKGEGHGEESGTLLVLTALGKLYQVDGASLEVISTKELHWWGTSFPKPSSFLNFIWPDPSTRCSFFFVVGYVPDLKRPNLYSVQWKDHQQHQLSMKFEYKSILPHLHSVACGEGGRFLVAIQEEDLFVKDMKTLVFQWHKSGTRKFTCVAVHPSDWVCATGDDTGRIVVWSNLLCGDSAPVAKSIYHWHTLPVGDLCFSASGTQIYSGGGECCLVKWDLNGTDNKRVLPRLGLPIRHLRSSATDEFIALAQADNSVKLVNSFNEVTAQIQNLTQCYIPDGEDDLNLTDSSLGGSKVFQTGLILDPNNQSLVTNGRPGHLQCYSFREDRHLYNLDITQQNFITAERNNPIPNSDVTHARFSKNGTWLVTAESRWDTCKCTELRLKFWKFQKEKQIFELNTSIEWPHEEGILSLEFQPVEDYVPTVVALTTGRDKKFKNWGIVNDGSIHGKSEWWNCEFVGSYRGLKCGSCSFSEDGSLLAVAFEKYLTVWATDSNELKLTLCHSNLTEDISLLEFGSYQSSHLVIACSQSNIAVWDVITSSLLWAAPFHAEALAVDPRSNLAAAVSSKRDLILFAPDNSAPLAIHKNVSSSRVGSALFVPSGSLLENTGLKSTLFFINSSQELCALLPPVDEIEETVRINAEAGQSVLTPFAQLMAEKTVHEHPRGGGSSARNKISLEGYKILKDITDQSPHAMPSLTYYCSRLLQSLSVKRTPGDRHSEVERAAKSSFRKIKYSKKKGKDADEEDEEGVVIPKTPVYAPQNFTRKEIDLDLAVNDDTTWIRKVFESDDEIDVEDS